MARLDSSGKYIPNKGVKVSQLTIDSMKRMGMKKALEKANSGSADAEYIEGARRMYGSRVTGEPMKVEKTETKKVESAEHGHVIGEAKAPMSGHVIGEARANILSKNAPQKKLST